MTVHQAREAPTENSNRDNLSILKRLGQFHKRERNGMSTLNATHEHADLRTWLFPHRLTCPNSQFVKTVHSSRSCSHRSGGITFGASYDALTTSCGPELLWPSPAAQQASQTCRQRWYATTVSFCADVQWAVASLNLHIRWILTLSLLCNHGAWSCLHL